jgi:hypothetical protein
MRSGLLEEVESLQNLLVSIATGSSGDNAEYVRLREVVLAQPTISAHIPRFVRTCRDTAQFWQFIKHKFGTYHERRTYLWAEFLPLAEFLEHGGAAPSDEPIRTALESFDAAHVQGAWARALDRRHADPEGAITLARTLLESVCKHVLDELHISYKDGDDLPRLYKATSEALTLAPSQHTEQVIKQILGGCVAVVEGLGALRNRLSDSHGRGKMGVRPALRHAELTVNLAGAMAVFVLETWKARTEATA